MLANLIPSVWSHSSQGSYQPLLLLRSEHNILELATETLERLSKAMVRVRLSMPSQCANNLNCGTVGFSNMTTCPLTAHWKRASFFPPITKLPLPTALLARFGFLRLLSVPENEVQADRLPFWHCGRDHGWCLVHLQNGTSRDGSKCGRNAGSDVSLHKGTAWKGVAARFKSDLGLACYRHSLWTFLIAPRKC